MGGRLPSGRSRSNAGGLGLIGAGGAPAAEVLKQIEKVRNSQISRLA